MNMPKSVSSKTSAMYRHTIHQAIQTVAQKSMKAAAEELIDDGTGVKVSCDGTWQKRGFSSKNGVATVLSVSDDIEKAAKVIDVEVLSTYCDTCEKRKSVPAPHPPHDCQKNLAGSAGSMESEGMLCIFKRSEEKNGLQYTSYLGDGNSKSYRTVSDAGIYNRQT